jgi:hypothetical protein
MHVLRVPVLTQTGILEVSVFAYKLGFRQIPRQDDC